MPHNVSLITTIAAALGLALVFGFLAVRFRLPALVGYLVAGMVIGPFTPGMVADAGLAGQLAEIGVMLLMFGVGLHFSIEDLLSVRRVVVPGALIQMAAATMLGMGAAWLWGWPLGAALVFGLALSVPSTIVLMRALENRGLLESVNGHIAVGWVIVGDVVMVVALVLLPPLAGLLGAPVDAAAADGVGRTFTRTVGALALFVGLMLVVGRRVFPWLLWQVARSGSRELFTLCVVAAAVGIAYGASALFGASFALGAFLAGVVLRESELSYRAAEESLPLRDAFAVLFFVSVGMLFDPRVLIEYPLQVLMALAVVFVGNAVVSFGLILAFRYPLNSALTVGAGLAQIGEFSFILAGLGVTLGLLPEPGRSLVLAAAILSIALNPLVFEAIEPARKWIRSRSRRARQLELRDDPLAELPLTVESKYVTGHVVLVGYGRVGRRIGEVLAAAGHAYVVTEENREIVERLREQGIHAVAGDASVPAVLIQAHVARARMLVIATPDTFHVRRMVEVARTLNPKIATVVRTHSEEEAVLLTQERVGTVFFGEYELAMGMSRHVLDALAEPAGHGHGHAAHAPVGPPHA